MTFRDQCNMVISGRTANCNLKLDHLELNFQTQVSGFCLEMKFAVIAEAEAYWQQIIEGMKEFSPLDVSEFLDEDPNSKQFPFALLISQCQSRRQGGLISLDLPSYDAFGLELLRWKHPRQPQTQ